MTKFQQWLNKPVVVVLIGLVVTRILGAWWLPLDARAIDSLSWERIGRVLDDHINPYQATTVLNWPPLWMQNIFVIHHVADALHISFHRALQGALVLLEVGVVLSLCGLGRLLNAGRWFQDVLIFGLVLNPATFFLVLQHGNFDVLVGLFVVLFARHMVYYQRTNHTEHWLMASLCLGVAITAKTVPLVLLPLLLAGWRNENSINKTLGAVLTFGPACLGLSVLYVISPDDITEKVLAYRSIAGGFGISGLIAMYGASGLSVLNILFYVVLLVGARLVYTAHPTECDIPLSAALLLMLIPCFGPGYGPQYLYWFLPILLVTFGMYNRTWRVIVASFVAVCAATYLVEYAFFHSHGMFLLRWLRRYNPELAYELMPRARAYSTPAWQTVMRLPLFVFYCAAICYGFKLLRQRRSNRGFNAKDVAL